MCRSVSGSFSGSVIHFFSVSMVRSVSVCA